MYPVYLINSMFDMSPDQYMLFCYAFSISVFSTYSSSKSFTSSAELNQTLLMCILLVKSSDFCTNMTATGRINAFSWK